MLMRSLWHYHGPTEGLFFVVAAEDTLACVSAFVGEGRFRSTGICGVRRAGFLFAMHKDVPCAGIEGKSLYGWPCKAIEPSPSGDAYIPSGQAVVA